MSNQIAVIGERQIVSVFEAFGFLVIPLARHDKAKVKEEIIKLSQQEDLKIIFVQEDFFSDLDTTSFVSFAQKPYPIIMSLPTHREGADLTEKILRESSIKAAGTEYIGEKVRGEKR